MKESLDSQSVQRIVEFSPPPEGYMLVRKPEYQENHMSYQSVHHPNDGGRERSMYYPTNRHRGYPREFRESGRHDKDSRNTNWMERGSSREYQGKEEFTRSRRVREIRDVRRNEDEWSVDPHRNRSRRRTPHRYNQETGTRDDEYDHAGKEYRVRREQDSIPRGHREREYQRNELREREREYPGRRSQGEDDSVQREDRDRIDYPDEQNEGNNRENQSPEHQRENGEDYSSEEDQEYRSVPS